MSMLTEGSAEPLLTILIPSYNRGSRVAALVSNLLSLVDEYDGAVEFVVSNNKSSDDTKSLLERVSSPNFRVVNRDVHLPTAEENMFASVDLCRGTYIWFHGDDDLPYLDTVRYAVELLRSQDHDALAFRSRFIDHESAFTGGWFFRMNADILKVDFAAGACAIGMTSSFAGITNTILRRRELQMADWREILQKAPIYSHVAWWLTAFAGRQITFVNRPLVSYRVDDPVKIGEHFKRLAERTNVPDFHFWTVGLCRLLAYLESKKVLTAENVSRIIEVRRDGSQYRLLDNMVEMTMMQALRSAEHREGRNHLSADILREVRDWVLHIDLSYFECMLVVEKTFALRDAGEQGALRQEDNSIEEYRGDFRRIMDRRSSADSNMVDFIGYYRSYAIYRHITGFVGFDGGSTAEHLHVLRSLDVMNDHDGVVYDPHQSELRQRIDNIRVRQRELANNQSPRASSLSTQLHSPEMTHAANRIADAIYVNANAIFEAGRFPHVSLARSVIWRGLRLWSYLAKRRTVNRKT